MAVAGKAFVAGASSRGREEERHGERTLWNVRRIEMHVRTARQAEDYTG